MVVDQINKQVRDIIIDAPHYGLILTSVNRYVDEKTQHSGLSVPTAAVYKAGINQFMVINPKFWEQCTSGQQKFVLLHELLHICFMHPTMCWNYADKEIFNIAADMEINQHVIKLDRVEWIPGIVKLDDYGLDPDDKDHVEQGTKWYYDYLAQEVKDQTKIGKKVSKMCEDMRNGQGGHPTWVEFRNLSDGERKLIEGNTARQMARAVDMNSKHIGNLPGTLRDKINEILHPKPTYNWKAIFRRLYTGYADTTYVKKTRKKESIRYPGMPAIKIKKHSRVLCAIDTSGSITRRELVEFFTEVEGIRRAGVEVMVAECDTRVGAVYRYRNLKTIENRQLTGGGGTSFEEPIKYLNERSNQFNMLIYLTDGYASVPETKSIKPIVWVLCRNGHTLEKFSEMGFPGYIIKIKDPDE